MTHGRFLWGRRADTYARLLVGSALLLLLAAGAATGASAQVYPLEVPPPAGSRNVTWTYGETNVFSACPAGDSVCSAAPARLRIIVQYRTALLVAKVGVPPDSIYITYTTSGTLRVNDQPSPIYADDSTTTNGLARINIASFSGCGTIDVHVYVSGDSEGVATLTVRTTDGNADGHSNATDYDITHLCDINYSGGQGGAPRFLDTFDRRLL